MRVPFEDIAKYGIVKDLRPQTAPLGAWTDARNISFSDEKLKRGFGYKLVFDPPSVAPYWAYSTKDVASAPVLIYAGLAKVYCVIGGVHTEITRGAGNYTGGATDKWNGGSLAGIPILNNGVDLPQFWAPVGAATDLQNLTNWDANHRAKVLRPFKNFLVALHITETGTVYPQKIRVSHPASPGALPSSWDETDATKDVRTFELTDWDSGVILDGVPLKDTFVIYKERSTHGMTFIGGAQKWKVANIFESSGILALNCACPFDEGSQHFVMTQDDLIIHNGQTKQSILTKRFRKWLQANISSSSYKNSFVFQDSTASECSFCFPTEGSTYATTRVVYNWLEKTITIKDDIENLAFVVPGLVEEDSDTWADHLEAWDTNTDTWNTFTSKPFLRLLLGVNPSGTKIHQLETTNLKNGATFTASIERTGLDVMGLDRYGHLQRDREQMKLVKSIWIRATGNPFQVQLGRQLEIDAPVQWSVAKTFTPGVTKKLDFDEVRGVLYGVRFSSAADGYWEVDDFDIDVEPTGQF